MFYNKHLRNLEALQAERAALKKKAKKKAKELTASKKKEDEGGFLGKSIGFITESLTGNSNVAAAADVAAKLAVPYIVKKGAQAGIKKLIGTAAKEVAFGYIKWKAISLAVRLISNQIKKKREKEAQ